MTCPCHCHRLFAAAAAETTCTIVHVLYTRWYCKCVNGIHTIQYICMVWYGMVWYRIMYVSKCLPRQEETTQLTTQPTICIQARSPWKPKIQTPNLSKFIYKPPLGNSIHVHISKFIKCLGSSWTYLLAVRPYGFGCMIFSG